jgi:hypothetical protein
MESLEGKHEIGECAETEESPLVRGCGVCRAEVRDDPVVVSISTVIAVRDDLPDPGEEDVEQNSSPAHAAHESQSQNNDRECNNPVDILGIVDLI